MMNLHLALRAPLVVGSTLLLALGLQAQWPSNSHPLRLGADQTGANPFRGELAVVRLYQRALESGEVANLARSRAGATSAVPGVAVEWRLGELVGDRGTDDGTPAFEGVGAVARTTVQGVACVRFEGGFLTKSNDVRLSFPEGGAIEVWMRPAPGTAGRIVDKITPGGLDGFLLDMHPGDALRFIVGSETLSAPLSACGYVPAATAGWLHVVATSDASGAPALYANGKRLGDGAGGEGITLSGEAAGPGQPLTLWYRQPARRWTEAAVIGNGRLGGMVWGGVALERIDLNEETLWSGEPYDNLNPAGLRSLPEIRRLLLAGQNAEAQKLVERDMNGQYNQCYLPLGALTLAFPVAGEVAHYRRDLDLDQGVARVQFEHEGVRFTREVFASQPDQAIVVCLSSDPPGRVSFNATLTSPLRHEVRVGEVESGRVPALRLTGRAPIHADPHYLGRRIVYDEAPAGKGMRFEARLMARNAGGSLTVSGEGIEARGCDRVHLMLVAATSYNGPHRSPSRDGRDPAERCDRDAADLAGKSVETLRAAHVADHQGLFRRVQLDLGRGVNEALPTDARLKRYRAGADPGLAALYFQFGRYLLIAGSRPGTQPLNLQGIWNKDINPAWSANWTLNCNAQINYWPVEVANLAECHEPLLDLTAELSVDGTNVAENLYGARGWVAHHNTDIWRQAGPVSGSACWSVFQGGSAWLCQHAWEHYAFSGDRADLDRAWPLLAGAARFYLDAMIPEPTHGWLVTAPDVNFENAFRKPDGSGACSCYGPTATMQMVRELFLHCLAGGALVDRDAALRAEIAEALPRLAPMQISPTTGELQEWVEDWQRTAPCQVLSSWGAVCSAQITPRSTPALAAGLRKIFDAGQWWKSGAVGSWQGAFQANTYARMGDGDTALEVLDVHLQQLVNPNLSASFGGAAEWEIDGNLGLTAAVGEMLLQSHAGEIELLPALPRAWASGSVRGLRARGGFTVDLDWKEGQVTSYRVTAATPRPAVIRLNGRVETVQAQAL